MKKIKKLGAITIISLLTITFSACNNNNQNMATLKTNFGDIEIVLYTEKAPETVKNFMELAKAEKYDNTIFHRVMDGFMIQGGDFENRDGTGGYSYKGPGTQIEDEFGEGLTHKRGVLSMANRGPNTGGSQFFIVQGRDGAPWLDGKHAIFGHVESGMDVVDKIASVEVIGGERPVEEVVLKSVEIK